MGGIEGNHKAADPKVVQLSHSVGRGVFSVAGSAPFWGTDPATMRDVILDPEAAKDKLEDCAPLERVWLLTLLDRNDDALREGLALLAKSSDRFSPLLVLAQVYQRSYRWHEAARLHEEALQLARTREREALVRHHIGRRLFDEARYRDAAAEFEWASDLYVSAGREEQSGISRRAMERARKVHAAQASIWDQHP